MLNRFLYLLLVICFSESILVKTKLGEIKGTERKSRDGKTYYAFTGVPYAKPPIGKLRLKNPEHVEPWNKLLDATNESPKCLQVSFMMNDTIGQEDCLYLSVYTPDVKPTEKLAVLVQTHGGAFRCGDAGPKNNPDYLIDGNVILVNVHYRLGVLGFLSTEDTIIPGNFGLKDQSLALHWVKENIGAFGGDDEKITVFGESAGGASAHYHLISPISKGILKGAISQSGVVNRFWAYAAPGTSLPLAKRVAEIVGCDDKKSVELLKCLQNVCPVKLIKAETDFTYWDFEPLVVFKPVQEPEAPGAFLTFDPLKHKTTLPWMTGIVEAEGAFKMASLLSQGDSVVQQFIDNMEEYLKKMIVLEELPKQMVQPTIELIKNKYFAEPVTIQSTLDGLKMLFNDAYMLYPMGEALNRHKGPVYQYLYDYRAGSSLTDFFGDLGDLGVSHGDDLITLFNLKEMFPKNNPNEEQVSRTMVKLWTNFAKYQKPTLDEDEIKWPKYDSMGQYMHITTELNVKRHLKHDTIDMWMNMPAFKIDSKEKTEL